MPGLVYTKGTWVDDVTKVTAARMNNIETGVENAVNRPVAAPPGFAQAGIIQTSDCLPGILGGTRQVTVAAGKIVLADTSERWYDYSAGTAGAPFCYCNYVGSGILTLAAATVGQIRLDQVILYMDTNGVVQVSVQQGTEGAAVTHDNRTGAVSDAAITTALGTAAWMRVADYLQTGTGSVPTQRDRRPWASGEMVYDLSNASGQTVVTDINDQTLEFSLDGVMVTRPVELLFGVQLNGITAGANYLSTLHQFYQDPGGTFGHGLDAPPSTNPSILFARIGLWANAEAVSVDGRVGLAPLQRAANGKANGVTTADGAVSNRHIGYNTAGRCDKGSAVGVNSVRFVFLRRDTLAEAAGVTGRLVVRRA